jgi:hypothetical protein
MVLKAFDIKVHHYVYKDPSAKGLAFRIHGLAEKLENLPVVKQATRCHFVFDGGGSDGDDGSHAATTVGLRLIDRLLYQLVTMCVCFCIFVGFLNMNCIVN